MQQGSDAFDIHVASVSSARQRRDVEGVFPDGRLGDASELIVVVTMQESRFDLVSRSPEAEAEKDRHCERFFRFARVVARISQLEGCWCDFPDPATGYPVLGARGGLVHNELDCAQTALKFPVTQVGACCVLEHPRWGTRCYPASLFVAAPRALVDAAIVRAKKVVDEWGAVFTPEASTSETGLVKIPQMLLFSSSFRLKFLSLPRALWEPFNAVREEYFNDLRLGPHVSLVDPFVLKSQLDRAVLLLESELAQAAFTIRLRRFEVLVHRSSCTVYAVPVEKNKSFFCG